MSVIIDKLGPHGVVLWCREDFWTLHCIRWRDDTPMMWWYEEWHRLIGGDDGDTCQLYISRGFDRLTKAKRKLDASVPAGCKVIRCRK